MLIEGGEPIEKILNHFELWDTKARPLLRFPRQIFSVPTFITRWICMWSERAVDLVEADWAGGLFSGGGGEGPFLMIG